MKKVIFDLDGTLLQKNWSYEQEYFRSILNPDDAEKILSSMATLLTEYEKNYFRYDINLLSAYLSEKTEIDISPNVVKKWIEAGCDYYDTVPGALEVLQYLRQKNKKIVALSNWFTDMNVERLKKAGLYDYFDEVYCSDRVDMKPNYGGYAIACGDVAFHDIVMIGDSLQVDVLTPLELGMDAVYFCPDETKEVENNKVKVIRNLKEIKEMY